MNSGTVLAGTVGFTAMTYGTRMMLAIGAIAGGKVKGGFAENGAVGVVRESHGEWRMPAGGAPPPRLGGDIAGATWPVLHDELLAEPLRESLTHQARDDVTCAA